MEVSLPGKYPSSPMEVRGGEGKGCGSEQKSLIGKDESGGKRPHSRLRKGTLVSWS